VGAKRCGHRPGKEIVSQDEMVDRIKAAVDARTDPSFFIMARTDSLAVEGFDRAVERAMACVEAGADGIFPVALTELCASSKPSDSSDAPTTSVKAHW
jgi:methylisocitrate lyase